MRHPAQFVLHVAAIEPDVQISRIRLSDKTSRLCSRVQRLLQFLNTRGVGTELFELLGYCTTPDHWALH
jgi:hypothetical protein